MLWASTVKSLGVTSESVGLMLRISITGKALRNAADLAHYHATDQLTSTSSLDGGVLNMTGGAPIRALLLKRTDESASFIRLADDSDNLAGACMARI
jgi:hypothetical protein